MMTSRSATSWSAEARNFRLQTASRDVSFAKGNGRTFDLASWSLRDVPLLAPPGSSLCVACARGNVEAVSELLKKRPSCIHDCDEYGRPGLLYAAEGFHDDHLACLHVMLDVSGCDVNAPDADGNTALMAASRAGRLTSVCALLKTSQVNLDVINDNGQTALHMAVQRGFSAISRLLLGAGAAVNIQDKMGAFTPLLLATANGDAYTVQALLDKGADVNLCGTDGEAAVHFACSLSQGGILELLVQSGASLNTPNVFGQLPIHLKASNEKDVRYLVRNGCDVTGFGAVWTSYSPLHYACLRSGTEPEMDVDFVRFLMISGADVDLMIDDRRPLDLAVCENKTDVVFELLAWNCSVRRNCPGELYPVLPTVINRNTPLVRLLYEAGTRISRERFNLWLKCNSTTEGNHTASYIRDVLFNTPRTLQSICRICIRNNLGRNIKSEVNELDLPLTLRQFLLLGNLQALTGTPSVASPS